MHGGYGMPQQAPPMQQAPPPPPPHQNNFNNMQPITNQPMPKDEPLEMPTQEQSLVGNLTICCATIFNAICCPFTIWNVVNVVQEYERAVILRNGIIQGKASGPGLFCIIPGPDEFKRIDLRERAVDIMPQQVLTKDSVPLRVDAVVYYKIFDPTKMVLRVTDANASTIQTCATNLRSCLSNYDLRQILDNMPAITNQLLQQVDKATDPWGIQVTKVEIKDVRLPPQIQRSMAAEAESSREAKAKILAAEGEKHASEALSEAAAIMNEAPAALQLRYLQTLAQISTENPSTILFPLPMSLAQ
ncbi:Oidioi.mRNA.OKI2018_I69.chr2.g4195.t1.cds [Oikopleura dioica]|uniref:Oidioi.mRNA.OKI2018_I69.chr2.g4195.t1.cds n=1 Tax=Oikopleura dioica TaxID=34765 RepID=A0ABN7T0T3_OIKDI|nr:Oidioi.mRNA.OKI2018_I69.chr2.g4195.t1.cds [Oikopleura dioica]